jgi:hypothetical protein
MTLFLAGLSLALSLWSLYESICTRKDLDDMDGLLDAMQSDLIQCLRKGEE